jgi:hypothetical protein
MKRLLAVTACALALPGVTLAASRTYDTGAFEAVSVAAGVDADITMGSTRSVVGETKSGSFDDLRISVEDKVLRIDRAPRSWFSNWFSWNHQKYKVRVVTPALHSLTASSGADVTVNGNLEGDFTVTASSGSDVEISQLRGGNVKVSSSSGSDIEIAGSCTSLAVEASSGSDVDAEDLRCETVTVQSSSGSDISVAASKRIAGNASSGSDVVVRGRPALVQVEKSSGADVTVKD